MGKPLTQVARLSSAANCTQQMTNEAMYPTKEAFAAPWWEDPVDWDTTPAVSSKDPPVVLRLEVTSTQLRLSLGWWKAYSNTVQGSGNGEQHTRSFLCSYMVNRSITGFPKPQTAFCYQVLGTIPSPWPAFCNWACLPVHSSDSWCTWVRAWWHGELPTCALAMPTCRWRGRLSPCLLLYAIVVMWSP